MATEDDEGADNDDNNDDPGTFLPKIDPCPPGSRLLLKCVSDP